ncbi:MAG TPA: hypothetical protein VME47_24470 [Acetobacteraceae bacterium]|nr:hypothetical protein [Acetobacteraceae bacterium]
MVKVVYANLPTPKRSAGSALTRRRVRNAAGDPETVMVLNADSPDFADGLTHVFARNVARVRRENKRSFGSTAGAAAKP